MIKITYKPASEQDIDYLLWLRQQTMTAYLELAGVAADKETHMSRIRYKLAHARIVFADGVKTGLLKCVKSPEQTEIIQIQIDPAFQGKGIGRLLLETVIAEARQRNSKVILSVLKQNPALKLYQRVGFTQTHEDEESFYLEID